MPRRTDLAAAELALRDAALAYPEAAEDFPWGHRAVKVKGKLFLILAREAGPLQVTVKLPVSSAAALALPFAEPTGYGLGKSGWVTASFGPADAVPLDLLREWIDESFRAVAPKKVLAALEAGESAARPPRPARRPGKRGLSS